MSGLSLGTFLSNLKSVAVTVLELLAFNAQKCRSHMTLATPLFEKLLRVMYGLSQWEQCMSDLKSVALTLLNWSD